MIVYDIDRLTRDPRHLEDAIETVEHYHRPIIDITGARSSGMLAPRK